MPNGATVRLVTKEQCIEGVLACQGLSSLATEPNTQILRAS